MAGSTGAAVGMGGWLTGLAVEGAGTGACSQTQPRLGSAYSGRCLSHLCLCIVAFNLTFNSEQMKQTLLVAVGCAFFVQAAATARISDACPLADFPIESCCGMTELDADCRHGMLDKALQIWKRFAKLSMEIQ